MKMMPGQEPYTDEEYAKLQELINAAAAANVTETDEVEAELKKDALEAAAWRGHKMGKFTDGISECKLCGMIAVVRVDPAPNEVEISGGSVALHCGE